MVWLALERLAERECALESRVLSAVEVLRVVDELDYLVVFLGLEQNAAVRDLHGVQRKVANTSPGEHQVARLFQSMKLLRLSKMRTVWK
jgi:hypothetical protein